MKYGDLIKLKFGLNHFLCRNIKDNHSIEVSKIDLLIFIDNNIAFLNGDLYKISSIDDFFYTIS